MTMALRIFWRLAVVGPQCSSANLKAAGGNNVIPAELRLRPAPLEA